MPTRRQTKPRPPTSLANLKPAWKPGQAPLSPGRPRLPDGVKARRAFLRGRVEEISPDAIDLVSDIMNDPRAENKDKLRAAEIALNHALPRQEEMTIEDERPLARIPPEQLESKLADIRSGGSGDSQRTEVAP